MAKSDGRPPARDGTSDGGSTIYMAACDGAGLGLVVPAARMDASGATRTAGHALVVQPRLHAVHPGLPAAPEPTAVAAVRRGARGGRRRPDPDIRRPGQ